MTSKVDVVMQGRLRSNTRKPAKTAVCTAAVAISPVAPEEPQPRRGISWPEFNLTCVSS